MKAVLPDGKVITGNGSKLLTPPTTAKPTTLKALPKSEPLVFAPRISVQKQQRHLKGSAPREKSYLHSLEDAQHVLDAYRSGKATLISRNYTKNSVVVKVNDVFGTYVNINNPNGLPDVVRPTNVFMIDSTKSPKVVPVNPDKGIFK